MTVQQIRVAIYQARRARDAAKGDPVAFAAANARVAALFAQVVS